MKPEESRKGCFGMIPEKKRDKLAVLKKAIREGAYKVKAEEIAEKILKERLFELALTLYGSSPKRVGKITPLSIISSFIYAGFRIYEGHK